MLKSVVRLDLFNDCSMFAKDLILICENQISFSLSLSFSLEIDREEKEKNLIGVSVELHRRKLLIGGKKKREQRFL